jgi:biopolymer transport protein ExbD
MAQLNSTSNESPGGSRKRRGVMRLVRHNLRVDMTPMVDLGFLLITFFVITTELTKPTVMNLYMPKEDGPPMDLGESNALTVLLDGNKIYCYNGNWYDAVTTNTIRETNLSGNNGLRKIIGDKQRKLDVFFKDNGGRNGLMLLIKPASNASYKNVVDILDEAAISMMKRYAIIKLSDDEKAWLKEK